MYNEKNLARLSYRELQVLAAQHRVPGNIKVNFHFLFFFYIFSVNKLPNYHDKNLFDISLQF